MSKQSRPEWPEEFTRKLETRVGDTLVETEGEDVEAHNRAVHEETLRQRTPEQIALVEKERKHILTALKDFNEIASMSFEETGDVKRAFDKGVFYAIGLNLEED